MAAPVPEIFHAWKVQVWAVAPGQRTPSPHPSKACLVRLTRLSRRGIDFCREDGWMCEERQQPLLVGLEFHPLTSELSTLYRIYSCSTESCSANLMQVKGNQGGFQTGFCWTSRTSSCLSLTSKVIKQTQTSS